MGHPKLSSAVMLQALAQTGGSRKKACELLGVTIGSWKGYARRNGIRSLQQSRRKVRPINFSNLETLNESLVMVVERILDIPGDWDTDSMLDYIALHDPLLREQITENDLQMALDTWDVIN